MSRVGCYVDGFNLYHAVHDLHKSHLKWLDLWALAQSLCRPKEQLVKVAYFSAYATWRPGAYARHRQYVALLPSGRPASNAIWRASARRMLDAINAAPLGNSTKRRRLMSISH
jgi:hypothetical protein